VGWKLGGSHESGHSGQLADTLLCDALAKLLSRAISALAMGSSHNMALYKCQITLLFLLTATPRMGYHVRSRGQVSLVVSITTPLVTATDDETETVPTSRLSRHQHRIESGTPVRWSSVAIIRLLYKYSY